MQASASPSPGLLREFWCLFHLDGLLRLSAYPLERWGAEPRSEDVAQGACLALRQEALDQVGALDEESSCTQKKWTCACVCGGRVGW